MYEELINQLRYEAAFAYLGEGEDGKKLMRLMSAAAEAIEVLSKKLASGFGEWISVKELLPKKTGWYFVACNELCYPNESFALYYVGNERFCEHNTGKDITKYVTHWMPLPEPPKEAE